MKEKFKAFYDSIWFSAAMSLIAVTALIVKVIETINSDDHTRNAALIIIWMVIIFHFVKETNDKRKLKG